MLYSYQHVQQSPVLFKQCDKVTRVCVAQPQQEGNLGVESH